MNHETVNQWRVFPRIIAVFVMYMMWAFHDWFTQGGTLTINEMSEWALLGYASVQATSIGFFKFYMDTKGSAKHD
jgi:hypothetical protein